MAQRTDPSRQQHWLDLIRLWQKSRLNVREFCRTHQLREPSFYSWRRTLRERGLIDDWPQAQPTPTPSTPAFVQMVVDAEATTAVGIDVCLAHGRRLHVRPGFDAATLRQLL